MKQNHLKCVNLVFIVILFDVSSWVAADHEQDTWMEPDAWTRDHLTLSSSNNIDNNKNCVCSEKSLPTDGAVSLLYFKKLISLLFNRKALVYDAKSDAHERSLILSLRTSQLCKLEELQDPRDLDNILTEIFSKARSDPYMFSYRQQDVTGFKALIFDIFRDMWKLTQTSEVRFLLIAVIAMICGWFLHWRYHIGYITLLGGSLFLFGYLHTYLECNRELEVKEMMDVLKRNQQSENMKMKSGFFSFLRNFFPGSSSQILNDEQMLKKSAKISLGFCRPDHVLIIYFNEMFLKYLELLLEQCTTTLTSLQSSLPFPYNMFAGVFLICIIGYTLKLTFKYIVSPAAWSHLVHRSHHANQPALSQPNTNSHTEDRLSGENLKMLLSAISTVTNRDHPMNAVSGVEEVKEAIESASHKNQSNTSMQSDEKTSVIMQDNNNASKEQIDDGITEVKLEDLPEDS